MLIARVGKATKPAHAATKQAAKAAAKAKALPSKSQFNAVTRRIKMASSQVKHNNSNTTPGADMLRDAFNSMFKSAQKRLDAINCKPALALCERSPTKNKSGNVERSVDSETRRETNRIRLSNGSGTVKHAKSDPNANIEALRDAFNSAFKSIGSIVRR